MTMTWSTCVRYVEQCDHEDKCEGRAQQRQCDTQEALHCTGAIDLRGIQQLLRHAGEPGKEEQHVVAGVLPHRDRDDRAERQRRIAQPVGLGSAEACQVVVKQPGAREKNEDEQRGSSDQRDQQRQHEQRAQNTGEAGAFAQTKREQQCQCQARDDRAGGIDEVVANSGGEVGIGEQAGVVVYAPMGAPAECTHRQRPDSDLQHRPVGEGEQEDRGGKQQRIRGQRQSPAACRREGRRTGDGAEGRAAHAV